MGFQDQKTQPNPSVRAENREMEVGFQKTKLWLCALTASFRAKDLSLSQIQVASMKFGQPSNINLLLLKLAQWRSNERTKQHCGIAADLGHSCGCKSHFVFNVSNAVATADDRADASLSRCSSKARRGAAWWWDDDEGSGEWTCLRKS